MCDFIKIRLRRSAKRSWKENQPLNIKTTVERPILKLGLPYFRWSFYFILLLVTSLNFKRIFITSHMTFSSASFFDSHCCGRFFCFKSLKYWQTAVLPLQANINMKKIPYDINQKGKKLYEVFWVF